MALAVHNDYRLPYPTDPDFFNDYYIRPFIRIGPYMIGVMFGYIYRDYKLGRPYAVKISYLANNN